MVGKIVTENLLTTYTELYYRIVFCGKSMRKRCARHLVEVYGCDARMAIQRAYIFGYDFMPYSYKEKRPIMETRTKKCFGF